MTRTVAMIAFLSIPTPGLEGERSGDGVDAPGMIWMALQEALDRQPDAPTRPVALDRLQRIPGACGRKPAARRHDRGETDLVQTDDAFEYVLDNIHVTVCRAGGPGVGRRDP